MSARISKSRGSGFLVEILFIQQFTNLIFRDNQVPGARQNYKRDLRGIEVARTICEWTFFHKTDFMND